MGIGTKKQSAKKQADKDSQKASKAVSTDDAIVVGGATSSSFSKIPGLRRIPRKAVVPLTATLILIVLIAGVLIANHQISSSKSEQLPTPEQAAQNDVDELLESPPVEGSSEASKALYYKKLGLAQADIQKYPEAIQAFKQAESFSPDVLEYTDYMLMAGYFHQIGDKTGALRALDAASQKMPTEDNEDTGYDVSLTASQIEKLKQEYGK